MSVDRPGEPLDSGFEFCPGGGLSAEALQRVFDKMDSVDAARALAAADSRTAIVG